MGFGNRKTRIRLIAATAAIASVAVACPPTGAGQYWVSLDQNSAVYSDWLPGKSIGGWISSGMVFNLTPAARAAGLQTPISLVLHQVNIETGSSFSINPIDSFPPPEGDAAYAYQSWIDVPAAGSFCAGEGILGCAVLQRQVCNESRCYYGGSLVEFNLPAITPPFNVQGTVAHELGHALGLDHACGTLNGAYPVMWGADTCATPVNDPTSSYVSFVEPDLVGLRWMKANSFPN